MHALEIGLRSRYEQGTCSARERRWLRPLPHLHAQDPVPRSHAAGDARVTGGEDEAKVAAAGSAAKVVAGGCSSLLVDGEVDGAVPRAVSFGDRVRPSEEGGRGGRAAGVGAEEAGVRGEVAPGPAHGAGTAEGPSWQVEEDLAVHVVRERGWTAAVGARADILH